MGADCATDAREETIGKTTTYGFVSRHGGDPLYRHHGLPVAAIAASLSCLHDRAGLFYRWIREGRWDAMNHSLVILSREQAGPRGYDAGKKIKGRKRHIPTDTLGHVVAAVKKEIKIKTL